jgi:hypothetical protein
MRFARTTLVVVLLAAAVAGLTAGCGSPQPSGISGRLTRLDFYGQVGGLENGSFVVRPASGDTPVAEVQSAHNGRYSVTLPPGRYQVEIYADWMGEFPSATEEVTVREGEITKLASVRSNQPAFPRRGAEQALRRQLRPWAKEVSLARETVRVDLYGAHAGAAAALVGATGLADGAHVYVALLSGKTTPESPSTPEADALREGGQVAYLVDPQSFAILRTHLLARPASEAELLALGGQSVGFYPY